MSAAQPPDPRAPQSVTRLLDHFDLLLATPDDVRRLEAAILQLAVQGELAPQDPDDEPATELLERIQAEKGLLIREEGISKLEEIDSISSGEVPFVLPKGWIWSELDESTIIIMGQSPSSTTYNSNGEGLPFYQGKKDFGEVYPTPTQWCSAPTKIAERDDVLISVRAPVGPTNLCKERSCIGRGLAAIRPLAGMPPFYLLYMLRAFESEISGKGFGTTFTAITGKDLRQFPIPLPPLAEQHRIVAAVDALLAQTRALAAGLEQADAALVPAAQAAFQALPDAPDATARRAAWQRIADHFDALTNDPRAIAALKQTILQLAVEGKLVPQDSEDEPASVLLARIEAEKERLVQKEKSKKLKQLPGVKAGEPPYALPNGWQWTRFGSITDIASNLTDPKDYPDFPHIAPNNIEKGTGKLLGYNTIQEDGIESSNHHFYPGQLLYSKIRPNLSKAVVIDFEGLCSADMYPIDSFVNTRYLLLYILSSTFLDMVVGKDTRVAMPKINQTELNKILVAVPPLAEQKCIVATVEGLLTLCDALVAGVVQAEAVRGRVLGAVLNGQSPATNGERINE